MIIKTLISREELNIKFRQALFEANLVNQEHLNHCRISVTELIELESDGSNWTNPVIRADNMPSSCYIQIVADLKKQFNINFLK